MTKRALAVRDKNGKSRERMMIAWLETGHIADVAGVVVNYHQ